MNERGRGRGSCAEGGKLGHGLLSRFCFVVVECRVDLPTGGHEAPSLMLIFQLFEDT